MNPQNNNQNDRVKNKFFNEELYKNANLSDVGSSTSGKVISWGVGGNKSANSAVTDLNILDSTQVINTINREHTNLNTEMFGNDSFANSTNGQNSFNNSPVQQIQTNKFRESTYNVNMNQNIPYEPVQAGINYTQSINELGNLNNGMMSQQTPIQNNFANMEQPSPLFAEAQQSQVLTNQQTTPQQMNTSINTNSNFNIIDENLASNQPLSMMALSGESIDESQKPKEVVEQSKFFQKPTLEDNHLNIQEVIPVSISPVIDPLAEPTRNLDINELIRSYVGIKYKDISMSSFNVCASMFGSIYFYFRKMYLYGIILVIINILLTLLLYINIWFYLGAYVVEFILIGLITNSLYLSHAKQKVLKITMSMPKASQLELQKICQNKGGTSLLIAILLNIGVGFISSILISIVGGISVITNLINDYYTKTLPKDTTATIEEVVEYTLPSAFVEYEKQKDYYVYYEQVTVDDEVVDKEACLFSIGLVAKYETSKELITHMADRDKRYNRVSTHATDNGEIWDMYDFNVTGEHNIYIARKFKNNIVLISYISTKDSTEGVCDKYFKEITNSIKEK